MAERLDQFMARANAAYYATHDPFKDFTTSPEITQVFGEILGLWAAVTWELIGRPDPVLLVEAGPGRGTLMADALRAISRVTPRFHTALRLHFIETSPRLRVLQSERLPDATWHDDLQTVPETPLLLLANEFLDALPIRQFVRRGDMWAERFVQGEEFLESHVERPLPAFLPDGIEARGRSVGPKSSDAPSPRLGPLHGQSSREEGQVFEFNESALAFARALGRRFSARPGAALFLDYGPECSTPGDSLQAIRNGRPANLLEEPGSTDLTAHVDFAAFAAAAREAGAATYGPIPQGVFLSRLGLFQRTDRLARTQPASRALALVEAARRIAEPHRMGRLFKALAVCHPGCPTPPGFETDET